MAVVAPATDDVPAAESFRAFLIDGSVTVIMAPGVWHAMSSPMPVLPRGARYLMLTDQSMDGELRAFDEGRVSADAMRFSRIVDYRATAGVELIVVDPSGSLR